MASRSTTPAERKQKHGTPIELHLPGQSVRSQRQTEVNDFPWELSPEAQIVTPLKDAGLYTAFERKYPPDRFGEEASENARVWRVYRERAAHGDNDLIGGWNKTLDVLLIFAGLFSAVATAFILEGQKLLEPDYSQYHALAYYERHRQGSTGILGDSYNPQLFAPSLRVHWTNGLWIVSLALSLLVALLAILLKQWLEEYSSRMRAHVASHRRWVHRHLVYNRGLVSWNLDSLVSALPLLLHAALFLFLAGLVLYVIDMAFAVALIVSVVAALTFILYIMATLMPLWRGNCPTATPMLRQTWDAYLKFTLWVDRSIRRKVTSATSLPAFHEDKLLSQCQPGTLDLSALEWMIQNLPATDEVNLAVEAIGGLDIHNSVHEQDPTWSDEVVNAVVARVEHVASIGEAADEDAVGRALRSLLALYASRTGSIQEPVPENRRIGTALARWSNISRYDVHLSAQCLLLGYGHWVLTPQTLTRLFPRQVHPYRAGGQLIARCDLICLSTIALIARFNNARQRASLPPVADLITFFCCEIISISATPASGKRNESTAWLLINCLEHMLEILGGSNGSQWVRSPEDEASTDIRIQALHTLSRAYAYPFPTPIELDRRDAVFLARMLLLSSLSRTSLETPLHVVRTCLRFTMVQPNLAITRTWPAKAVAGAFVLLRNSKTRPSSLTWDNTWGFIFRTLMHQIAQLSTSDDYQRQLAIRGCLQLLVMTRAPSCTGIASALWSRADLNAAEHHSRATLLDAEGSVVSFWRVAWEISDTAQLDLLAELCEELIVSLCQLKRAGANVSVRLQELLAMLKPSQFLHGYPAWTALSIARHARELSPHWWETASTEIILQYNAEQSNVRWTPVEFVELVKTCGTCTECPPSTLAPPKS
ncbi:hypothetical protein BKA62DRAFT_700296 [Auriculariales sp. MPI-PUGE-AT-0066]|nr:hypothetical protein BKA62DRAFT_700296 [Auriculariales sp. MPI-PUGE-AT-0066]